MKRYNICYDEVIEYEHGNWVKFDDTENLRILKKRVKELFDDYLDIVEETSEGKTFRPIQISCCRAEKLQDLAELIHRIKDLSHK